MRDLLLLNGHLHTQDPAAPNATAVALRDGHIFAVGSDEKIRGLARPGERVVDLAGRLVLPGLVDGHFHYWNWTLGLHGLDLAGSPSLAAVLEGVGQAAAAGMAPRWIVGQGWNETVWADGRLPGRADLDAVAGGHPVLLYRNDMHLAVANSAALAEAGITGDTPDPPGGVIGHDAGGRPDGLLRDLAINLVSETMPPATEDETVAAMRGGMARLHRLGLTGLHDYRVMGGVCGRPAFRAWQRLQAAGDLDLRVWMHLPGERIDEAIALGLRTGFGDERLRIGHLKFFVDGGQGVRTAWMLEPYEDSPGCGISLTPVSEILAAVERAEDAGLAVAIHAIGDQANHRLLAGLEELRNRRAAAGPGLCAPPAAPHRVEHVQMIQPEDVPRLRRAGVVASVQPLQVTEDIPMVEASVGKRARLAYNFRSMLDAGVPLAPGSDCPVVDPDPMWGIHAAVTRQRRNGWPAGGWHPEQRLTVAEAVWGYTMGTALASGRGHQLGSITPGKLADLVVLDRDIFDVEPMAIADARACMTIFDGRVVYEG